MARKSGARVATRASGTTAAARATTKAAGGYDKPVALVLQGGGALGSYQAGVHETLHAAGHEPAWVAGISIGAINAALIAGNAPAERTAKLREFWETITAPSAHWLDLPSPWGDFLHRHAGAAGALLFGQPGFFAPVPAWQMHASTSAYDTGPLRETLERLVDFDRINAGGTRLSVGAVSVRTGNMVWFDSRHQKIGPEHIMASGALPPGFPAVEIEGELYWDGGLVSNTPLFHVLNDYPRESMLAFQVDLFPARGETPGTLDTAMERAKEIQYSSRTRAGTDAFRKLHDIRFALDRLIANLTDEQRETVEGRYLSDLTCDTSMDIVHLIYRPEAAQGSSKDYQFSRATMHERWAQGMADAAATIAASPWLEPAPPMAGVRVFDVLRDKRAG